MRYLLILITLICGSGKHNSLTFDMISSIVNYSMEKAYIEPTEGAVSVFINPQLKNESSKKLSSDSKIKIHIEASNKYLNGTVHIKEFQSQGDSITLKAETVLGGKVTSRNFYLLRNQNKKIEVTNSDVNYFWNE